MRSLRVGVARRVFFGLAFRETLERVFLPRFDGRFFFGMVCLVLFRLDEFEIC
jgi:hypothetical protein